MTFKFWT